MRAARLFVVVGMAVATAGAALPGMASAGGKAVSQPTRRASAASVRALPTCTPGKPAVVGSNGTSLTITVPQCADETGLTGYRIFVLSTAAETAFKQVDVGATTPQTAVTGLAAGVLYRFQVAGRNAEGVGPKSAKSADAVAPFTNVGAMVDRMYLDFANVAPTSTQKATWIADLASGAKTAPQFVDALEQDPYTQKQSPLVRLYIAYFNRPPDKSGFAYWMGKYRSGTNLTTISLQMANSSEFKTKYGSLTNKAFVQRIYVDVLGRAADPTGLAYWTKKLDDGTKNRGQVMVQFSESSEYKNKMASTAWTVNLFHGMLRRVPTASEVTTWKAKTKAELIAFLFSSFAYADRVGTIAPPAVTTESLPTPVVGSGYSAVVQAVGGSGTLVWSVASGALPPGLTISTGGGIQGTPTKGGSYTFALKVTDAGGRSGQGSFAMTIASLSITTSSLPDGTVGSAYPSTAITKANAYGAVTWSVTAGSLPPGLSLSAAGTITGTPTAGGTKNFTVKVTDAGGSNATKALSIAVPGVKITTTSLPNGVVGTAYPGATLTAINGSGSLYWQVTVGDLPPGLFLDSDGSITGTPTGGGVFTFTVSVSDDTETATKQLSITVPALTITTSSVPDGVITTPYPNTQLAVANDYFGATWTVSGGSLPTGMSLSSEGVLGGTPTVGGAFTFTARAEDNGGSVATKAFTFNVSTFAMTTAAVPDGYVGIPYAFGFEAAGGTGLAWSVTTGALPAGLTLVASTGILSGTPTTLGSSTFTVKVTASGGKTASRSFTMAIDSAADWPQARHDDSGRSYSPNEDGINAANVPDMHEEWAIPASLQPVIAGSYAYAAGQVPGHDGTYAPMALDLSTGDLVWYGPMLPEGCTGGAVAVTATAVVVQCNTLLAYSRTGSHDLLWNTSVTDPGISTNQFLISGTSAITWGSDRVLAYRLSDGQRLWQQLLPSGAAGISDVAASGSSVVVAYDDRIRALSSTTGAQQWTKTVASPSEVMIADGWVYNRSGGGVSRYALANGANGWSVLAGTGIYDLIGVDADTVYAFEAQFNEFGQVSAVLRALKASDGSQRWEAPLSTRIRGAGITKDLVWILESQIYSWGRDSNLIAFRRTDGVERKRVHFDDNSYGVAAFGNGHVLFSQGGSFGGPDPYRLRSYGFTPPTPKMTSRMVPTGRVAVAYSTQLTATGGTGALSWTYTGTLPTGLTLSTAGVLSGTPTAPGATRIQVKVTDANGRNRTTALFVQVLSGGTNSWNSEGHNFSRDGYNAAETTISRDSAAQLAYRWKTLAPAGTEQSIVSDHQPTVVGGKVFDADQIGRLAAYSTAGTTANRAPLWTLTAMDGGYYPDAPVESGGVLYLADSNRYVDAVNATTGARIWHKPGGPLQYQRNELAVVGTRVLFLNTDYDLVAINTSDGNPSWGGAAVTLDGNELSGSVAVATDGTRAFVLANCEVKAITASTGAVAWTVPVKAGGSTNCGVGGRGFPMVADGAVFASTYDGSIAIEAATGSVRWRAGTRGGYGNGGGAIANGVWALATDETEIVAMDLATGEVLWHVTGANSYMQFAAAGDLLVARGTYNLVGYDLLTGEQIWDGGNPDASSYTSGGPSIADGKIFVSTRDGVKAFGPP